MITGVGLVTAAGVGGCVVLDSMAEGRSFFDSAEDRAISSVWPVCRLDPAAMDWPLEDPWWTNNRKFANASTEWAITVARQAISTSGLADVETAARCGVVVAVGGSGDDEARIMPPLLALASKEDAPLATVLYDEVPDYTYVRGIMSQTGQFIAKATGFRGSNVAVYGEASASGLGPLALASRLIECGELDRVIVVGVMAPSSPDTLFGLDQAERLGRAATAGRGPFDRDRDGTLLGQAAAAIVIETAASASRRGALVLGELEACESVCGRNAKEALDSALETVLARAAATPRAWWAHGAGAVALDRLEGEVVGARVSGPVTASKGTIGNAFDCSGLVDVVLTVEALRRGELPPVGLLQNLDPDMAGLDVVTGEPRRLAGVASALVTTLGGPDGACAGAAIVKRGMVP